MGSADDCRRPAGRTGLCLVLTVCCPALPPIGAATGAASPPPVPSPPDSEVPTRPPLTLMKSLNQFTCSWRSSVWSQSISLLWFTKEGREFTLNRWVPCPLNVALSMGFACSCEKGLEKTLPWDLLIYPGSSSKGWGCEPHAHWCGSWALPRAVEMSLSLVLLWSSRCEQLVTGLCRCLA